MKINEQEREILHKLLDKVLDDMETQDLKFPIKGNTVEANLDENMVITYKRYWVAVNIDEQPTI